MTKLRGLGHNPIIFKLLPQIRNWMFNKIEKLTRDQLRLSPNNPLISARLKSIILSLQSQSSHPIAISLRDTWIEVPKVEVRHRFEIRGEGVQGIIDGIVYKFVTDRNSMIHSLNQPPDKGNLFATLFKDGQPLVTLDFIHDPKPTAKSIISCLKQMFVAAP